MKYLLRDLARSEPGTVFVATPWNFAFIVEREISYLSCAACGIYTALGKCLGCGNYLGYRESGSRITVGGFLETAPEEQQGWEILLPMIEAAGFDALDAVVVLAELRDDVAQARRDVLGVVL